MSNLCKRCGHPALSVAGLEDAGRRAGILVTNDTIITSAFDSRRGEDFENQKGFECSSCGNVYCMECILAAAPSHSNGGKGCFECRASYRRLE